MEINGRYIAVNAIREIGKIKKFKCEDTWYFKITWLNGDYRLIREKGEADGKCPGSLVHSRECLMDRHREYFNLSNPMDNLYE